MVARGLEKRYFFVALYITPWRQLQGALAWVIGTTLLTHIVLRGIISQCPIVQGAPFYRYSSFWSCFTRGDGTALSPPPPCPFAPDAKGMGYIIPTPVVRNFLAVYDETGTFGRLPNLGLDGQTLEVRRSPSRRAAPREAGASLSHTQSRRDAARRTRRGMFPSRGGGLVGVGRDGLRLGQ